MAETRAGVRSGGIKNALNVPFGSLLAADGTLKSGDDLHAIFSAAGVELNKDTVHSCNSGFTACVVDLSMRVLGNEDKTRVYDGSWSEYGSKDEPKW